MALKRGQTGYRALNTELAKGPVLPTYTVAQLTGTMAAAQNTGRLIRVSNGSAGNPCLAMSDGTNWKVIALGSNVATS